MKRQPSKIVLVRWLDAHTTDSWSTVRDLLDTESPVCESVGWLVGYTKDAVVVACTRGEENREGDACAVIHIPKGCIIGKVRTIAVEGK